MSFVISVVHGPNLNLLGDREPDIYGSTDLASIDSALSSLAEELGCTIQCLQSNHEGVIVDAVHAAKDGMVINPAGYTHSSVAIRDAIAAKHLPTVEVHLSNIFARESFRKQSLIAPVCLGSISGFGMSSYMLGLRAVFDYLTDPNPVGKH